MSRDGDGSRRPGFSIGGTSSVGAFPWRLKTETGAPGPDVCPNSWAWEDAESVSYLDKI